VCNSLQQNSDYTAGGNLDAVELDFADGTRLGATSVGSVQLGQGLTNPNLVYGSGLAANALGLPDATTTYLGNGVSRITLCFSLPCPPSIAAAVKTDDHTLALQWPNHFDWQIWRLFHTTNLGLPWQPVDFSNIVFSNNFFGTNIVTVTNLSNPSDFFRLQHH